MSFVPHTIQEYYPTNYHLDYHRLPSDFWHFLTRSLSNTGNFLSEQWTNFGDFIKQSHITKDGFEVCIDVRHFQPNEISLKTENDEIVVNAKHDEKEDEHGHVSREFTRRYKLPKGFRIQDLSSSLSSDGVLSIKCPHAPESEDLNVRHIQIHQTGPARATIKSNEEKKVEQRFPKQSSIATDDADNIVTNIIDNY